jgi:hypothetical protein
MGVREGGWFPGVKAPLHLDGTMLGDVGFDPLGIATTETLPRMREAELRHARLAMVATWGWPIGEGGLWLAQKLVPTGDVCTGNGCLIDQTGVGQKAALQLADIALASEIYWGALLTVAVVGELRARTLARESGGSSSPSFDPLQIWTNADGDERSRLELAEIKHGRLAMVAVATYWSTKLLGAMGSANAALAAGVPKGALTFAHQIWGETCVYSLTQGLSKATTVCYPQYTNDAFDFVLSWEIMFRVVSGYFREPYF